ncbi:MAG: hypothetical protein H6782_02995 [Candidatus Nomurabacteria bacterium]|nr:MAG: hypothetical protein H6782_02995 [Candidatus Nomurabacteria bacterium]
MTDAKKQWEIYTKTELSILGPLLAKQGIELDYNQPHISGERFLMSGKKVVLIGKSIDSGERLIIKSSADVSGIGEIEKERLVRQTLEKLPFAYSPLLAPKERWFDKNDNRIIVVTEFIDQPKPYLSLPLIEQFDLAIQAFRMLESAHVTTAGHKKIIKNIFSIWSAESYQKQAILFAQEVKSDEVVKTLQDCLAELSNRHEDIERYCGFLTHDDFALHNFRFRDKVIYLIDQSSLIFGNKHESWARFLNYMLLYNRELGQALLQYLKDNVAEEELASLRLLRIYKVMELLNYYSKATNQSGGDVLALSKRRIVFWHYVLIQLLTGKAIEESAITSYQKDRDRLRSEEEVARQRELQQLV